MCEKSDSYLFEDSNCTAETLFFSVWFSCKRFYTKRTAYFRTANRQLLSKKKLATSRFLNIVGAFGTVTFHSITNA